MEKQRIEWLDIAKGIGIMLVVLGHAVGYSVLRTVIYSFHMPLFFFISGILFSKENKEHFAEKKFRTLIVPYYLTCIVTVPYFIARETVIAKLGGSSFKLSFTEHILPVIIQSRNLSAGNEPIWFLACLFWSSLAMLLITKHIGDNRLKAVGILLLILHTVSYFFYLDALPFCMNVIPWALVFIISGYLYSSKGLNSSLSVKNHIIVFTVCTVLLIAFAELDTVLKYYFPLFAGIIEFIPACIGIIAVISLSRLAEKIPPLKKVLSYYGRNSLLIVCFHMPLLKVIMLLFSLLIFKEAGLEKAYGDPFIIAASTLLTLLCFIPVTWFFTKYLPWFSGRKK